MLTMHVCLVILASGVLPAAFAWGLWDVHFSRAARAARCEHRTAELEAELAEIDAQIRWLNGDEGDDGRPDPPRECDHTDDCEVVEIRSFGGSVVRSFCRPSA
jgi:hypothetical protein